MKLNVNAVSIALVSNTFVNISNFVNIITKPLHLQIHTTRYHLFNMHQPEDSISNTSKYFRLL